MISWILKQLSSNILFLCLCVQIYTEENFFSVSKLLLICFLHIFLRAKKERTFLSALIKKFLGVLGSIPPSGKQEQILFISIGISLCCCAHLLLVEFLQQKKYLLDFGPILI